MQPKNINIHQTGKPNDNHSGQSAAKTNKSELHMTPLQKGLAILLKEAKV